MKTIIIFLSISSFFLINNKSIDTRLNAEPTNKHIMTQTSFYDIDIKTIDGKPLKLSDYKGKKIIIVNVASECGYTPQYEQLELLYKENVDKLLIIGCPSNDFGAQEPGSNDEIVSFCKKNYGVTFPLTDKVSITKNTHTLYQWLTQKEKNGNSDNEVKWNFTKFLIDEHGHLVKCLPSGVTPMDDQIVNWVKA
jgi:glutathione peroxidase